MADLMSHPQQNEEHDGASDSELVIEACRRNNTDLLLEIIEKYTKVEDLAKVLNESKTVLGSYAYHEAASRGHYEIIDMLLDQDGFECDPVERRMGDTPLHSAIRWHNELPKSEKQRGYELVDMMLEAGSDPRIRNKAQLKASDLADPSDAEMRDKLTEAEYMITYAGDFVDGGDEDEDEGPTGSASDSDNDEAPPAPPKK